MDKYVKELDGLRGIAILLVVTFHVFESALIFTDSYFLRSISQVTSIGWVGVDIFFTLSGFLITSILLKSKNDEYYFKNFYVRRVLRISPLYYLFIFLVIFFAPNVEPEFIEDLGRTLPILLLYQQNWSIVFNGFGVMTQYLLITWSLAIEEQFYLLWPVVVYYFKREQLIKISIGYIALSIIARFVGILIGYEDMEQTALFFYFSPIARFEQIIFGALLAIFITDENNHPLIRKFSLPTFISSLIIFISLCLLALPESPNPEYPQVPLILGGYTITGLFSASLIGIFMTYPVESKVRRFFQSPVLIFLGKYSYSMYIFHIAVILITSNILIQAGWRGWQSYIFYVLIVYMVTILIALLTWHLLEKHMLKLKKYFEYKKFKENTSVEENP